jgi:hypothetical protein
MNVIYRAVIIYAQGILKGIISDLNNPALVLNICPGHYSKNSGDYIMSAIKERMTRIIQIQPEDASYEEILKELAFEQMIILGLNDLKEGKTISNEEMKLRISEWQK